MLFIISVHPAICGIKMPRAIDARKVGRSIDGPLDRITPDPYRRLRCFRKLWAIGRQTVSNPVTSCLPVICPQSGASPVELRLPTGASRRNFFSASRSPVAVQRAADFPSRQRFTYGQGFFQPFLQAAGRARIDSLPETVTIGLSKISLI
jgi:hypothetical protein